jgi:hypothetical protein
MLYDDRKNAAVKTATASIFPKGTKGKVIDCRFIPDTSTRVYLFQTKEKINGLVDGPKTEWYLDRDLTNF